MMQTAFAGSALPRAARLSAVRRDAPRCELETVSKNFPAYRRNKAPVIEFDGDAGFRISMERVKAFAEVDADTEPLLDYSDPDVFNPTKPGAPSAISWPSGDGRTATMTGTMGSFTQPNLKTYGPFPDFFKVRFLSRCASTVAFYTDESWPTDAAFVRWITFYRSMRSSLESCVRLISRARCVLR